MAGREPEAEHRDLVRFYKRTRRAEHRSGEAAQRLVKAREGSLRVRRVREREGVVEACLEAVVQQRPQRVRVRGSKLVIGVLDVAQLFRDHAREVVCDELRRPDGDAADDEAAVEDGDRAAWRPRRNVSEIRRAQCEGRPESRAVHRALVGREALVLQQRGCRLFRAGQRRRGRQPGLERLLRSASALLELGVQPDVSSVRDRVRPRRLRRVLALALL